MFTRTLIAAVSVATAALVCGTAASAQDYAVTRSMVVSYADLDLKSAAGQDRLDARIRRAAGTVCGQMGRNLRENDDSFRCRVDAIAGAEAQVAVVIAAADTDTRLAQTGSGIRVSR